MNWTMLISKLIPTRKTFWPRNCFHSYTSSLKAYLAQLRKSLCSAISVPEVTFFFFFSLSPSPPSPLPPISGLPFTGFLSHFANIAFCSAPAGRNSATLSVHIWNPSWEDEVLKAMKRELDYFPYMFLQLIPHFSNKFSYWFLKVSSLVLWLQKCKDRPCEQVSQFQEMSWGKCLHGEK